MEIPEKKKGTIELIRRIHKENIIQNRVATLHNICELRDSHIGTLNKKLDVSNARIRELEQDNYGQIQKNAGLAADAEQLLTDCGASS